MDIKSKLKIKSSVRTSNGILFHVVEGSEKLHLCLRGVPNSSSWAVVRCTFAGGKWLVNETYNAGDILNSSIWDITTEMSDSVLLCMISERDGYIEVPIVNGKFKNGREWLSKPDNRDITDVWLMPISKMGKTGFSEITSEEKRKNVNRLKEKEEKSFGALVTKFNGEVKKMKLVDSGGCEPELNPTHEYDHVKVYYMDGVKSVEVFKGAKFLYLSGNYVPEHFDTHERYKKASDKAQEKYEDLVDITLSSTLTEIELTGIGNVGTLRISKNVKKLELGRCDIERLEFDKDCSLDFLHINACLINQIYTNKKIGKWPTIKNFSSYSTKYYWDVEFPEAPSNLYGNFYANPAFKDLFGGNDLEAEYQLTKVKDFYYGFGHKFNEEQLIQFCSETGMGNVLSYFNLNPKYPITKYKYIEKSNTYDKYLCNKEVYDDDAEKWKKTPYKSVRCYNGTPVLKDDFWLVERVWGHSDGSYYYTYLDPSTNTFNYVNRDKVEYQPLTKERYLHLIKTLETYYGKNWKKKIKAEDVTTKEGLLLTETNQKFAKIKTFKIEDLDWKILPDRCSVLTMTKNGCWWGNEKEYGLRAEGGSWSTYGGTGERWVNICADLNIEIEPVKDWTKMYKRPEKYKVTPKPKKKDFGLCPFSGSGNNPDRAKNICSRTEDGSKGDCGTCRVAAEWEEIYG